MSNYRNKLNEYFKTIAIKADKVLSIGIDVDDRTFFKSFEAKEFETMDIDEEKHPTYVFDINKQLLDDNGDMSINNDLYEKFDVVLFINLFDYVYDPMAVHKNLRHLLKPGGLLITNYPFVYPIHKPLGVDYLRYTKNAVNKYLSKTGFDILDRVDILGNDLLLDFYQLDGMKKTPDDDHRVIGYIVQAKKI